MTRGKFLLSLACASAVGASLAIANLRGRDRDGPIRSWTNHQRHAYFGWPLLSHAQKLPVNVGPPPEGYVSLADQDFRDEVLPTAATDPARIIGVPKTWLQPHEPIVIRKPAQLILNLMLAAILILCAAAAGRRLASTRPKFSLRAGLVGMAFVAAFAAVCRHDYYRHEDAFWKLIAPYRPEAIDIAATISIAGGILAAAFSASALLEKIKRRESSSMPASSEPSVRQ